MIPIKDNKLVVAKYLIRFILGSNSNITKASLYEMVILLNKLVVAKYLISVLFDWDMKTLVAEVT